MSIVFGSRFADVLVKEEIAVPAAIGLTVTPISV
jgi:hypothetical protein